MTFVPRYFNGSPAKKHSAEKHSEEKNSVEKHLAENMQ